MPSAIAYRRAPLLDPAYVALSDSAVHTAGLQQELAERALAMVDVNRMSALDAMLATKLGGYTQAPPMPDVEGAAALLPAEGKLFADTARAACMAAAMNRDKEAMLRVLGAMRTFLIALPRMSEAELFAIGADMLRLTVDLYRRTGQRFLLDLMENLRARLPDVSGVMHMFPFQTAYQPEKGTFSPQEQEYHDRMQRFATGKLMADSAAMTALLSQYSGSGRDAAAAKAGLTALQRFHGMPSGAFSADPWLAGRDPARAAELDSVSAQAEAWLDALLAGGDPAMAEQLEKLLVNVLPDLLTADGLRTQSPTNRLADDDSCQTVLPETGEVNALLRALYAIRRAVWLTPDDQTLTYMLPVSGGCVTRLAGVPVRLNAQVSGHFHRQIAIRVECRQPVSCAIRLRVPSYAQGAQLSVSGDQLPVSAAGQFSEVRRTFRTGDVITLSYDVLPRVETGYRGSASVYVGAQLMALALPESAMAWRYALLRSQPVATVEEGGAPYALIAACEARSWQEREGFILPPPQNVPIGDAYELTLIPFAGTKGRIAAFPVVKE